MFKKGGFEVTPVVYPVAIKVGIHYNRPVLMKLHKTNILVDSKTMSDNLFWFKNSYFIEGHRFW